MDELVIKDKDTDQIEVGVWSDYVEVAINCTDTERSGHVVQLTPKQARKVANRLHRLAAEMEARS